ncbi:MAG: hypothetical protein R3D62_11110 [Xanthobacteraceae bacterium]
MRWFVVLLVVVDFSAALLFLSLAASASSHQPARILLALTALCTVNAVTLVSLLRR